MKVFVAVSKGECIFVCKKKRCLCIYNLRLCVSNEIALVHSYNVSICVKVFTPGHVEVNTFLRRRHNTDFEEPSQGQRHLKFLYTRTGSLILTRLTHM